MTEREVGFSRGLPQTVLDPLDPSVAEELAVATASPQSEQFSAITTFVARHPRVLDGWAELADRAHGDIERYAYARVGYHRGLDALRASGWRGSGYVRWSQPSNRGFLRCLDHLRQAAGAIGEVDEEERCRLFLYQLDPDGRSS